MCPCVMTKRSCCSPTYKNSKAKYFIKMLTQLDLFIKNQIKIALYYILFVIQKLFYKSFVYFIGAGDKYVKESKIS